MGTVYSLVGSSKCAQDCVLPAHAYILGIITNCATMHTVMFAVINGHSLYR